MVKNILAIFIGLTTVFAVSAQLTFSQDTASLIMEDGFSHKANINVSNNSGHPINLSWNLISSTLNDNDNGVFPNTVSWKIQFCECNTCYNNDFGPILNGAGCADPMADGDSIDWYLSVNPNGFPMLDAEWIIEVENLTDNVKDTLVYLAIHPNSVQSVSHNADITSYPNPANTEFIVNYELTNVNAPVLNVYSIIGGKIAKYNLNNTNGSLSINTLDFENGMYFYTIEEEGQRVFIQKFNVVH
jgi:hypothetical protein